MSQSSLSETARIQTLIQDGPVQASSLDWPGDCGAEALFRGRTRQEEHSEFGPLLRLEYEVYEPMASKLLEAMAHEAAQRWGCGAIRLVHARGPIEPGQASVVVQVAAPHRGEAFAACRYLIDRLKHELPIWKRQIWQGGQTFSAGCCAGPPEPPEPPASPAHDEQGHGQSQSGPPSRAKPFS